MPLSLPAGSTTNAGLMSSAGSSMHGCRKAPLKGCAPALPADENGGPMNRERRLLFGLHLDAMDMDGVVESCRAALTTRKRLLIGVLNAAKVIKLRQDALLRKSLLDCDLLLADGQSIVWASRLLRRPLPERIAGIDIFERLLQLAHKEQRSIYLLRSEEHRVGKECSTRGVS